ncbi:hypothetical protein IKE67_08665 [bacterium]|nr:hypothetical protein [bacterium]
MEKFTKTELQIVDLIRQQKTKSEIQSIIKTTAAYFNVIMSNIFRKTDEFVGYKTERSKFDELRCYLRNNPTAFSPMPTNEDLNTESAEPKKQICNSNGNSKSVLEQITSILSGIEKKHQTELSVAATKLSVISEIVKEIEGIKIE